jgi:hopene-associated glycosyltransferase HpnB
MLYPFAWVNRPDLPTAAAAGGCMLVRRRALDAAGGLSAVAHALIDDCALASLLKPQGRIWLGLTTRASSLRAYPGIGDVRQMIARCAFAQLRYSPLILLGTVAAIAVTYIAPPLVVLFGTGAAQMVAAAAWGLMALSFQPTLRFYGVSRWWGPALPAIAGAYLAFTLDSAWQHWRGRGGTWKGRVHVPTPDRS